ncbi:MAG: hypothetical protein BAJATHORv1_100078 [Candidatus Thorarchaeota archaeon]|nr:MAG: hypothetical protein BAJATHORv1_100078 [Candidatus Thorarchaeota archaeon]
MHRFEEVPEVEIADETSDTIEELAKDSHIAKEAIQYLQKRPKLAAILIDLLKRLQREIQVLNEYSHYHVDYLIEPDSECEEIIIKIYLNKESNGLNLEIRRTISNLLTEVIREQTMDEEEFVSTRAAMGIVVRGAEQ